MFHMQIQNQTGIGEQFNLFHGRVSMFTYMGEEGGCEFYFVFKVKFIKIWETKLHNHTLTVQSIFP